MRAVSVIGVLATIISLAAADPHGACGCQINTDGALDDDTTDTCCTRFGGKTSFLTTSRKVRFSAKYCLHGKIDGNSWYNCCRQFLPEGDGACPW
ncbi:hypothetical protein FOQG_09667 [Fusarium oxysporum f. sp. raphani 54005]|uniref:Uncharacterized protein n=2 Tax=Fusarium oxysporum f. sp. raphani TaxID=96318 RepID=X0BW25_FUSOX|nr:hypothetical protein FOQG_09667 [Fusarium oxysporum f. sp. raphani 54005]KAG7427800.1 hypothetical protein Forpi1262_v010240 [Fusarium oxysporum f. sp. raphani]